MLIMREKHHYRSDVPHRTLSFIHIQVIQKRETYSHVQAHIV